MKLLWLATNCERCASGEAREQKRAGHWIHGRRGAPAASHVVSENPQPALGRRKPSSARVTPDSRRRGAPESGLVVVEGELDDVSSTKVRALVRARKWGELERSGDVHAEVVACLRAMPADGTLGVGGDDT